MQCVWVFSTTCSTVFASNISTQVGQRFFRKKTNCPSHKPLLLKENQVIDYSITAQLLAYKTEARQWTCDKRFCLSLKFPLQQRAAS